MKEKINPFNPNSPVSPGMFAGRINEINALEKGVYQTKCGYPSNFLITGERGIGKSSLLNITRYYATGKIETKYGKFNFTAIDIVISNKSTLSSMIEIIGQEIKQELGKVERVKSFVDDTWSFIKRLKIMGSGIEAGQVNKELDLIINTFSRSLSETCRRIISAKKNEESKDGIVFFIDEADNACPDLHLGYFFKAVTEALSRHECNNIMFIVAGLPDVVEKMSESHPSSIRIFKYLVVETLSLKDRRYVINRGLAKSNEINEEKTTISSNAKDYISHLSEGYPHFIQQFSYSAFEFNVDGEISKNDVRESAFSPGGALAEIGTRYYKADYYLRIQSDEYREVLRIMAWGINYWINKSEIREEFSGSDNTLTDALATLNNRNIILKNPSVRGQYRLQQKGFAIWIKFFGQQQQKEK